MTSPQTRRPLPVSLTDACDTADALLNAVEHVPIPSGIQQRELARRMAAGDRRAREDLVLGNMRLVAKVAHQFTDRGLEWADLIQEGSIGLMRAIDKFDPDRKIMLSTYATWWIRQAIQRALAERARTIRLPIRISDDLQALRQAERAIVAAGKEPSVENLAAMTGLEEARVREARALDHGVASLDRPIAPQADTTLGETIPDDGLPTPEVVAQRLEADELYRAMFRIGPHERAVLALSFGLDGAHPHSAPEIGRILSLSPHAVRRLQQRGMQQLEAAMGAEPDAS